MGVSLARSSQWSGLSAVHDIAEDDSEARFCGKGSRQLPQNQHSARRIHVFFVNVAISAVPTTVVPTAVVYSCG